MLKKNKVLSAGIWYTVGNIFIKGINFLTVPLFSRLLTTDEFGLYNMFLAYDSILCIVTSLALYMSVQSAKIEFQDQIDKYISCITVVYLLTTLSFLSIVFLLDSYIMAILGLSKIVLYMLVLYSFGSGVVTLYNQRISLDYDYKRYLLIAFLNSIGNIILSLILILTVFSEQKGVGRIVGVTLSIFGISILLLKSLYKKAKPEIKKEYIVFGLKYSIPIIPHGISQVILAQFDRIMISELVNNAATGIYSLAGYIKLILIIITESLSSIWRTWFYDQIVLKKIKNIQNKATIIMLVFSILTIGVISISPELIIFLGGTKYITSKYIVVPMIVDAFVIFLYNIVVPAEYYKKKTSYIMFGTLFAAILNIITNYIFILKYGYIAAAYTTLFAYICYLMLHIIISKKLVGFFIIPLRNLIEVCTIILIDFFLGIVFIDDIMVRYMLGIILIFILSITLFLKYKDDNKIKEDINYL